jgi:peptidyl-prolyl cis-trans isomerase B (cyclophilin B)
MTRRSRAAVSTGPRITAAVLLAVMGLAACDGGGEDRPGGKQGTAKQPTAPRTTPAEQPVECRRVPAPKPRRASALPRPTLKLDPAKSYRAVVATSCGSFTITLAVKESPKTAASFVYLAQRGFYDGLTFHRVVSGFVIQGGDPLGTGTGGPGYNVVERPPEDVRYTRGAVAMAKAELDDPGTSGSQFFVVTGEDAQLPAEYALLGRVTAGQDVVDAIGVVPTFQGDPATQDRPRQPVVIQKVTIR